MLCADVSPYRRERALAGTRTRTCVARRAIAVVRVPAAPNTGWSRYKNLPKKRQAGKKRGQITRLNPSTNRRTNPSTNLRTNPSTNRRTNRRTNPSTNRRTNRDLNRSSVALQQLLDDLFIISAEYCPRFAQSAFFFLGSLTGRDEVTEMGPMPTLQSCMKPNIYPQTPDGGWGWVVAVAFFFVEVFTYGIVKIFGIFMQDLSEHFGETNSRVSWIVSICVFTMSFMAPLSSLLSKRFGFRPVVMIGGVLISLGTVSTSFTTSITQMYITTGFITGLGYCLTFLPTVTLLSQYFDKRRSLVTSFASTGECFALFALAPAFSALKDQVGWRNCMMVIGLLQAFVIGCGALLRPILIQPECSEEEAEGSQSPLKANSEKQYELENEFTRTSLNSVDSGVQSIASLDQNAASSDIADLEEVEGDQVLPSTPLQENRRKGKLCFCDFSLLKVPNFICYSLFGLFSTLGFFVPQLYVIQLSMSCGVRRNMATYMLSIMAAAEIFGRLSIGWLMNRRPIRKIYILLICTVLLSLVLALFPTVSSNFSALACCCAAFGFLFGTVASTHIPMLAEEDVLGLERMTMGAGVYVSIQSFAGLAGPPVAGVLVDMMQDYGSAFYFSAAGICVGAMFLSLVRPAKTGWRCCRRDRKCVEQKPDDIPVDFLEVDLNLESSEVPKNTAQV